MDIEKKIVIIITKMTMLLKLEEILHKFIAYLGFAAKVFQIIKENGILIGRGKHRICAIANSRGFHSRELFRVLNGSLDSGPV